MTISALDLILSLQLAAAGAGTGAVQEQPSPPDSGSVWDSSDVGACTVVRVAANKAKTAADSSIAMKEFKHNSPWPRYIMYWDATPGRNPTRSLHRQKQNGEDCSIGFFPFSETINFSLSPSGEIPGRVVTSTGQMNNADGSSEWMEAEYVLNRELGTYSKLPLRCYRRINGSRTAVDCLTAFQ